jgi:hypothetical protein
MASDPNRQQSSWARLSLNQGAIKRAFPGGVPSLEAALITRCIVEDLFFVVNVHLHPLPATVADEWVRRKYDRVDLRFVFREWSVTSQSGSIHDLVGLRKIVLAPGSLSIQRQEGDGFASLLECTWKFLDVKTLPDVLDAQLAKDRDINDTDIRPTDRQ